MNRTLRRAVVLAIGLSLVLAAGASANSLKTSCNAGGRVFSILADHSGAFDVTLMWAKAGADNDIFLLDGASGDLVGLGVATESRFETVTIGVLPGVVIDVIVSKFSGPNGSCFLNYSNRDGGLIRVRSRSRLRYRGTLDELAAADPRYQRARDLIELYQALKAAR